MSEIPGISGSRRQFIRNLSAITGAAALAQSGLVWGKNGPALRPYVPLALAEPELATLKTLMSRLIPSDPGSGGAIEAQAYVYVDRALAGMYAAKLPAYRQGLAALQALAKKSAASSVVALPAKEVDALIARLEAGSVTESIVDDAQQDLSFPDGGKGFFGLLRQHTVEGTFSDPMYGGNQGFVGWRIVAYPGVQYVYSKAAQAVNGKFKYANHSIADFGGKPLP